MLIGTNLLLSFKELIKNRLQSTEYGLAHGFNVLSEEDIRNNVTPTSGSATLWMVHTHISPTQITLPFIGVEVYAGRNTPIEMGSVNGKTWIGRIHVFGKSRAQRTDIASYLASPRVIQYVPVYDYTSGSPVFIENAEVDISLTEQESVGDQEFEGSWTNREVVSITMFTMSN